MSEKKSVEFVKWFSELNKDSKAVAGGKGANLAEIFNLKVQVPPGFVVTAQAYDYFIEKAKLKDEIKKILDEIDYENTKQLDESTKKIRELILNSKFPKEISEEVVEAYENLDDNFDSEKGDILDVLNRVSEPVFVAVRSSATAEDLADASFAGQQDSFVNVKGHKDLLTHIKKCFASLFTSRATYYRNKKGFKHETTSLAVVVQKMVDSDKSGVVFSKDPSYKNDNVLVEAVYGLGEGIVSGRITPDKYIVSREIDILDKKISDKKIAITRNSSGKKEIVKLREEKSTHQVLKNHQIERLAELAIKLEEHYQKAQDIEFAVEGEEIYIVQTRPITTIEKRVAEGETKTLKGEVVLEGLGASPGIGVGKIKVVKEIEDLHKINKGDVLVTGMTNPDMVVTMQKCAAIVTDEGGMTAHAAIVSREMGIPAIVGTQTATTKLKEGEIVTVDGYTGKVYKGKVSETEQKEVLPIEAKTKTKIKVVVDLPSFAQRAAKSGIKQVGLTRIEGIIAESGKHPEYFLKQKKIEEYEDVIFQGVQQIAKYFDELWVRTSDIRSDEFENLKGAPSEKEANPMLGMHGIRYGLKNPDILKAELRALRSISESGKTIGILLPQVISVEDVQKVKEDLDGIGFEKAKVGVMVETPAAVQMIRELCDAGINFISFGTNDLTQYMLAVDRGNEQVQDLYNEMHPAILYQLEYVIRVCKRKKVETSICGQAGSKKEMVEFLVGKGIDSISVNADMAKEISDYIAEIESKIVEGTDEEPRKYQRSPPTQPTEEEELKEEFAEPTYTEDEPKIAGVEDLAPPGVPQSTELGGKEEKEEPQEEETTEEEPQSEEEISKPDEEQIEKDIEAIEEEKKEYLEEHPEEREEKEIKEEKKEDNQEKELVEEEEEREFPAEKIEDVVEEKTQEEEEAKNHNEEVLDIF